MSTIFGVPDHARGAWLELHDAIDAAGGQTPCRSPHRDRWNGTPAEVEWAAYRCRECPVITACLAYAVRAGEKVGAWGGTTPSQRKGLAL